MEEKYPVLKGDIFYAKYTDPEIPVRIRNTTTEKDFEPTPHTIVLLDLCTGQNTVKEIVQTLSREYGEDAENLEKEICSILDVLQKRDIVAMKPAPAEKKILAKKITATHFVEQAQIEITNRCNLSCLHCYNMSGDPHPNELTTDEIFSAIDALSSMGVHTITFSGGEPLLHPDIFHIVKYARKKPMTVAIFTNGTLITEKYIKKFKELGVAQFAVSVDSINPQSHDTLRGKKWALKKTLQSINMLNTAGFPVRISLSVCQLNKNEIVDTIQYFRSHGIVDYQMAEVNYSGRGIDWVAISPEEYHQVLKDELLFKKECGIANEFPLKSSGGCGIGENMIYIKFDGTILPCHACHKKMGVGNIRNVNLESFWDTNDTLENLRNMRAENDPTCKECTYLAFCDGCIANAFVLEGNIRCYDPYACARRSAHEAVGLLHVSNELNSKID